MREILVLGGGVGGTLAANLVSRKLKKEIDAGRVRAVTVIPAAIVEMGARQAARANGAAP